ncbi:hypothetical protein L486_04674 [Kwoniella mangroviensis CBS 10435]|uniref:Serine/threonine-protein kinase MEC1 n=1 Tax=Kwoniella mangroviensis CBS 10435 TaxID=1331196 RepID=A0A1B9INS0_9TREE|nr:hypothetical protein L486_04674 [Kwoniella mangroviensis CBS 10435]
MTPDDMGDLGSATGQELLENLIKEGLTPSGQDADPSKYRKLVQVLLQNCILKPIARNTPPNVQQASYTLTILQRQTKVHPGLLYTTTEQDPTPFYYWLLPKLVHAAAQLGQDALYDDLLTSMVAALLAIGRNLSEDDVSWAKGSRRLGVVIGHMNSFSQDILSGRKAVLFGHSDLPQTPITLIFVLSAVLQSRLPFSDHHLSTASSLLSQTSRLINTPSLQIRYTGAMTAACVLPRSFALTKGCLFISSLPNIPDHAWREGTRLFYETLCVSDPALRLELWWSLYPHHNELDAQDDVDFAKICFLLSQVTPNITTGMIRDLIQPETLNRWKEAAQKDNARLEQLDRNLRLTSPPTSKKRKRSGGEEERSAQLVRQIFTDFAPQDDLLESLLARDDLHRLNGIAPQLPCALAGCSDHTANLSQPLSDRCFDLWLKMSKVDMSSFRSLALFVEHTPARTVANGLQLSSRQNILEKLFKGLGSSDRPVRLLSGRVVSLLYVAQFEHSDTRIANRNRTQYIERVSRMLNSSLIVRETSVLLLADLGRHSDGDNLCSILKLLIRQIGSHNGPLKSLAYTQLIDLAKYHRKTPYTLISPFLKPISIMLAEDIKRNIELLNITMQFIGMTRKNFLETTLVHTVPALVLSRNGDALKEVASVVQQKLGVMLMDNISHILAQAFLRPDQTDSALRFLVSLLKDMTSSNPRAQPNISISSLMTACIVDLVVMLIVELGDQNRSVRADAKAALIKASLQQTGSEDIGSFLKPLMLGVISQLNDMLHDVQGKKTVDYKRKIIKSFGSLIRLVGDSMAGFSPQIMASLQSTLGIPELREETLKAWALFISTLRFSDVGPFVGRTTGALIANWYTFGPHERDIAAKIINDIADNVKDLSQYVDEIVGLDDIPELQSAATRLTARRRKAKVQDHISKVLDRTDSKNVAIATASTRELKSLLLNRQAEIETLVRGDTFDGVMSRLMTNLLSTATRDGDCQELRALSYECMGIIGALDPDRLGLSSDTGTMTIAANFTEPEESKDFALHLIRDLLVDAFRATNDTKHQTHLAYAIQELLKFCGFSPKILHSSEKVSTRTRDRWESIPKDQLETLTPLLESRFSISDGPIKTYTHPIYASAPTYREWLQNWTTDLIGKVMSMAGDGPSTRDSKTIFGAFRGVLKNQDVTVAHHLLPHLVLNVLLSGLRNYRLEISSEINAVLQEQVNPTGPADKRTLSAQVIFDLMDHLSKWLRLYRMTKTDRNPQTKIIEEVLSEIETELMANAALQSKAYARALRSFEERTVELRNNKRDNSELQTYFERLHQIYSELDEPDGMEGVSAFVISPSLEHQIREHESTGRWTSAQSCWEVRLQQSPDNVSYHVGLLKCLRNLGHYDTLRTHIRGVLSRHPEWSAELSSFEAEAAWIIGDWTTVKQIGSTGPAIGQTLLALHEHRDLQPVLLSAREKLGTHITAKEYGRAYESLLQLHLVREIEMIQTAKQRIEQTPSGPNRHVLIQKITQDLIKSLESRFNFTSPTFRIREALLSIRRTAYSLVNTPLFESEIGDAWILSSKIARKAGYDQTAYSAVLQAKEVDAPFAFIQQAKLNRTGGGIYKALTDVDNALKPFLNTDVVIDLTGNRDFSRERKLAKAVLLVAKWANETDRFERNHIIGRYQEAIARAQNAESPYYHLGHYYDSLIGTPEQICRAAFHYHTCHSYSLALQHGVKYIYQTMPRMLTLWLDLGENKELKLLPEVAAQIKKINDLMERVRTELPTYQFLTAFPQIISRIVHPSKKVAAILKKIMAAVIVRYPQQALWPTVGAMQSKRAERRQACLEVTNIASTKSQAVAGLIKDATNFSGILLKFTDDKVDEKKRQMSMSNDFDYVTKTKTRMILPLQDALTCALPTTSETVKSHNPFPFTPVTIAGFDDRVDIMPSLQKPKKVSFMGSDGRKYPFLCKPHDDLRKDARLMDLNSMINKLLKSASESRRRQLYIRTYAVMPLNEECGLLEWVANTNALKSILEKGYQRHNKRIYIWNKDKENFEPLIQAFRDQILPKYTPTVFNEWFLITWPEPSAWLASRMAYGRTLAVMSMIGYVLGLGDRHGENILFDGLSGDTVHVDLNCLFDKGKTFEIPERVPFRLTQNMVDALGVTGVEGVFRKAAEITMGILRNNSDSLMSVLEAFVHDPLIEWIKIGRSKSERDIKASADRNLKPIKAKLRGIMEEGTVVSVPSQVEALIKEATSLTNLSAMYIGWAPWL